MINGFKERILVEGWLRAGGGGDCGVHRIDWQVARGDGVREFLIELCSYLFLPQTLDHVHISNKNIIWQ